MYRSIPHRSAWRFRPWAPLARLDWFALYIATTAVLFFAFYPWLFLGPPSTRWSAGGNKPIPVDDLLTIVLSMEAFLLIWLWLELPRRRKAETALHKTRSVHGVISRICGKIVQMKADELEEGLQAELSAVREMLGVDQVFWFQQNANSTQKSAVRVLGAGRVAPTREFSLRDTPWIAREVWSGSPVWIHRLKDLPAEAAIDRENLEACGIKSLALIPSIGEDAGISALALTSAKEINREEEIIAQLSILASVFANACAKKAASDAGQASELKFRHLFDDSPIGVALLDSGGRIRMANGTLAKLLGRSSAELSVKSILDVAHAEEAAPIWLHLQELAAGVPKITHVEKRFVRGDGSIMWGRMTLSLLGNRASDRPFLMGMIEDVTETKVAREQLERSARMLTLALEASRTIAWEYDATAGTICWVDRKNLRDHQDEVPTIDLVKNVLSHVVREDREKLQAAADVVLQTGCALSTEFRMTAKDGSIRWMLAKGEVLRNSGEAASKILGVTVDVSGMKRAQLRLEHLAKRLIEAQEEERKRISRELHDDIGQRVALLAIELDLMRQQMTDQGDLRERLEQLQASTSELGTDLHHLSHALHSSKLKHLGLESALRELCQRMSNKPALLVELNCAKMTKSIPEDNALALYRVAQEALNNVIRHSIASKASLSLEYSDTEAKLVISDNGQGFDVTADSEGIGLVGMRERLRAVGGEVHVFSSPNCGVEICARVPLGVAIPDLGAARQAAAGSLS